MRERSDRLTSSDRLLASAFGVENTVTFRATVGSDGRVLDVHPQVCVGFGFEDETVKAVKRYRYEPAVLDGSPVASTVVGSIQFIVDTRRRR